MNKKILLSLLMSGGLIVAGVALADNAALGMYPSSTSAIVGNTFNTLVSVNGAGNTVCTVKGTLNFNGLACQNITVASGLMPQTTPTCANPNFTIGLAKCTTAVQTLFSVSVKGNSVGQAGISLTNSKVIGAGVDVPFALQNGNYTITAAPVPVVPTPVKTQLITPDAAPKPQPEQTTSPVATDNSTPNQDVQTPPETGTAALVAAPNSNSFYYFLAFVALVAIGYGIYRFAFAKKKK